MKLWCYEGACRLVFVAWPDIISVFIYVTCLLYRKPSGRREQILELVLSLKMLSDEINVSFYPSQRKVSLPCLVIYSPTPPPPPHTPSPIFLPEPYLLSCAASWSRILRGHRHVSFLFSLGHISQTQGSEIILDNQLNLFCQLTQHFLSHRDQCCGWRITYLLPSVNQC